MVEMLLDDPILTPEEREQVQQAEQKAVKVEGRKPANKKQAEPKAPEPEAEAPSFEGETPVKYPVFIPSRMADYREEKIGDKKTRHIIVSVNGRPTKVSCDVQTEVDEITYGALSGLLEHVSKG